MAKSKASVTDDVKTFTYTGKDKAGNKVKGELKAESLKTAKNHLRSHGIKPQKLAEKKEAGSLFSKREKKIKPVDIAIFARQMATMATAGIPIVQALDVIASGSKHRKLASLILQVKLSVEGGDNFSEALRKHPLHFDDLFCNLIEAGERSGSLDDMLNRIADYKEKIESLKRKIKKALFYPAAVIVIAFGVTALLLIKVVPTFKEMFAGFGAELPAFTQLILKMSDVLQNYGLYVLGIIVAIIWFLFHLHKTNRKFRHRLQELILRAPVFGNLFHKSALARFTRTLSTTFAAGLPLPEALLSVAKATGNIVYSRAIIATREHVSTGEQLYIALAQQTLFPSMVIQMTKIGEESGSLEQMLGKVADVYEEEVDTAVDGLSSLLEPMIMVFLGVVVGGMVIAMYLPIFKLGSVI